MSHKNNIVDYLKYRTQKRKDTHNELDDWYVDEKWLRSFDGLFNCKWCGRNMFASHYDRKECSVIMSCGKPLCPGNFTHGPTVMPNWKEYRIDEMTNQVWMNELCK